MKLIIIYLWDIANKLYNKLESTSLGKKIIDKVIFPSKSLFSLYATFVPIIIFNMYAYNLHLTEKIDEYLKQTEGFLHFIVLVVSWVTPDGYLYVILLLAVVLTTVTLIRIKELSPIKIPRELTGIPNNSDNFIGRKKELKEINKILNDSSSLVLINGIGGIGKTSLAAYYVTNYKKKYKHYAFIDGGNNLRLNLFNSLEHSLTLQKKDTIEDDFREVIGKLRKLDGKTLLVIDDIKDVREQMIYINELLQLRNKNFKLLFTSRERIEEIQGLDLDILDKEDAKKLFNSIYEINNEKLLINILEFIDYHTYFIKMVAYTLKNNSRILSPEVLIKKFENGDFSKINKSNEEDFGKFLNELFTFDQLSNNVILLLKKLSILPSIDINYDDLVFIFQPDNAEKFGLELEELVNKGWLIAHGQRYKLHQIIKKYILSYQMPSFEEIENALDSFNGLIENSNEIQIAIQQKGNLIYFESLKDILLNYINQYHSKKVTFITNLANIYRLLGEYDYASALYKKALILNEEHPLENNQNLIAIYNNLGLLYWLLEKYEEALGLHQKVLNTEQEKSHESLEVATSYNNIALVYRSMGNYPKSLECHKKALRIREKLLNKDENRDIATSYNNLGLLYHSMEKYDDALRYFEKAIKIREKLLSPEHPDLASSYDNIAELHDSMQNYNQALDFFEKALKIKEKSLGTQHLLTAVTYHNLSNLYYHLKKYKKALYFVNKAIPIRKKVLQQNNSALKASLENSEIISEALNEKKAKQQKIAFGYLMIFVTIILLYYNSNSLKAR